MTERYDIAIVGAGIAGASLAAAIGSARRVVLLEAEDTPGYHATGRSAAFWEQTYGGPVVAPLTIASGPSLRELGVLRQRGALYIGREGDAASLGALKAQFAGAGVAMEAKDRAAIAAAIPRIRPGWDRGIFLPECSDIDVAALHQHYLAEARRTGTALVCRSRIERIERRVGGGWTLAGGAGPAVEASVLVDAAGAWADEIAEAAAIAPLGIAGYRSGLRRAGGSRCDVAPL